MTACQQDIALLALGAITAHQVDLKQLRLVRQGDDHSAIIEEVETTAGSCGGSGIS